MFQKVCQTITFSNIREELNEPGRYICFIFVNKFTGQTNPQVREDKVDKPV